MAACSVVLGRCRHAVAAPEVDWDWVRLSQAKMLEQRETTITIKEETTYYNLPEADA